MGLNETFFIYLVLGLAVAAEVYLVDGRRGTGRSAFLLTTAVLFWPLYVPLLLAPRTAREPATPEEQPVTADEMASAIARVEVELDAALSSLDGWAESAPGGRSESHCRVAARAGGTSNADS